MKKREKKQNGFENHKKWINALEIYLLLLCDVVVNRFRCAIHDRLTWMFVSCSLFFSCVNSPFVAVVVVVVFSVRFFVDIFFGEWLLNLHCFCFFVPPAATFCSLQIWCDNIILSILAGWLTGWLVCSWIFYTADGGRISMDDVFFLLTCRKTTWIRTHFKKNWRSSCMLSWRSHLKMVHHQ